MPFCSICRYTKIRACYKIKNREGKSTIKTFSALFKNDACETFYAGSKKGKTDGLLRCYGKKEEQLQSHGFRFQEAEDCESWVRFEAVYRHNYAHQITNQLLEKSDTGNYIVQTDAELQKMIAIINSNGKRDCLQKPLKMSMVRYIRL